MSSGTGPPSPENATPRLDTEAARKVNDDRRHIVHPRRPDKADLRRMRQEYRLLCKALAPVERVFWALEQCRAELADQLANEGVAPFCRPRRGGPAKYWTGTLAGRAGRKP